MGAVGGGSSRLTEQEEGLLRSIEAYLKDALRFPNGSPDFVGLSLQQRGELYDLAMSDLGVYAIVERLYARAKKEL